MALEPTASDRSEHLAATERAKTVKAIEETARRARSERPALPHPFETDANLAALLGAATSASTGGPGRGLRDRLGRILLRRLLPGQLAFNQTVVDLIHQLDHRDRQLREDLADLHQQDRHGTDEVRPPNGTDRTTP